MLLAVEEKWRQHDVYYFDQEEARLERFPQIATVAAVQRHLDNAAEQIVSTRPTAVNLSWAVDRMRSVYRRDWKTPVDLLAALHSEAMAVYNEDLEMCMAIGRHGAEVLKDGDNVLTHCNTGGLATDETRPLLQGARLNAWECDQRGIPVSVLCDGAAASVMSRGMVSLAVVGADRIAANGDTANKIGTLNLAIVCKRFEVPFYVAAPSSTIDTSIPDGAAIPIEERAEREVKEFQGVVTVPENARAVNPAFDVTPHDLIAGFITEAGVIQPPFTGED